MPTCKNCGSRIDKFNKDRCPICGFENPFNENGVKTVEITSNIDEKLSDYHTRKKSTMLVLFILLGFFGVPFFYLHQKKNGFIFLALNLIAIGLVSFILAFYAQLMVVAAILIAFGAMMVVNTISGIILYKTPNLKDGNGEFVA